jgi:hypothetical protein
MLSLFTAQRAVVKLPIAGQLLGFLKLLGSPCQRFLAFRFQMRRKLLKQGLHFVLFDFGVLGSRGDFFVFGSHVGAWAPVAVFPEFLLQHLHLGIGLGEFVRKRLGLGFRFCQCILGSGEGSFGTGGPSAWTAGSLSGVDSIGGPRYTLFKKTCSLAPSGCNVAGGGIRLCLRPFTGNNPNRQYAQGGLP